MRGRFTRACEVSGDNEEIDDPVRRRDRCELRRTTKPPTARTQPLSLSCFGSTWKSPPMMNGSAWEVIHWPIVLRICQFSWVSPAPVCMQTERISAPPGTMPLW